MLDYKQAYKKGFCGQYF